MTYLLAFGAFVLFAVWLSANQFRAVAVGWLT
ncbi:hypothetical protein VCSRO93_0252 [Vibrio cholerae]|nr:hypothetical protein VCSRO93_0252 [Vibrio cholerae]